MCAQYLVKLLVKILVRKRRQRTRTRGVNDVISKSLLMQKCFMSLILFRPEPGTAVQKLLKSINI